MDITIDKIKAVIKSLINEVEKENNINDFESELISLIRSMINVKYVSIKFLEYGINIYLNDYSIFTVYFNKRYEITKIVFYKYDLYFGTERNYTSLIEVLNNLHLLDINKIKSLIQKKYLNPKKYGV